MALSHITNGKEAEAPPADTPSAAHHGSVLTMSFVDQAARLSGAHKTVVTRATITFTETNDSPVEDMLENQRQITDSRGGGTANDISVDISTRSIELSRQASTLGTSGRCSVSLLRIANRQRLPNRPR